MKLRHLFIVLCVGQVGWAHADIYKYVDPEGHVTYSSTPIKGGKKLELEPLPTMQPFNKGAAEFPRVDGATQRSRDETRRKILQDELAKEQQQLAEARQKLQDAQDNPRVSHVGGKTFRNVEAYEESVKTAQDEVTLHERNVEALKTEISQIK